MRARLGAGQQLGSDVRLADYADRWLARRASELQPATIASYRERLDSHILPALGRLPLRELTRATLRDFLAAKRQEGHAKNGVRLMRATLSALLRDALDDGLVPDNPARQLGRTSDRLAAGERTQAIRPMTTAQRDAFLVAAWRHAPAYASLFEILVKTGLRPSEAYALRADDVDLAAGVLHVSRAWVHGAEKLTKTTRARMVDLTPRLVWLLRPAVKRSGLVWATAAGTPLDQSKVGKVFRRVLRRAGLSAFRLYDLRHTYASLRLAAGAPVTYVAAQLGHANPETTLRFYARWIPSEGRQWIEQDGGTLPHRRGNAWGGGPDSRRRMRAKRL